MTSIPILKAGKPRVRNVSSLTGSLTGAKKQGQGPTEPARLQAQHGRHIPKGPPSIRGLYKPQTHGRVGAELALALVL